MSFLVLWVLYASCGFLVFAAVFIWAVRAGQFRDQDRARSLSLNAEWIAETDRTITTRADRLAWVGVIVVGLIVVAVTVCLAWARH